MSLEIIFNEILLSAVLAILRHLRKIYNTNKKKINAVLESIYHFILRPPLTLSIGVNEKKTTYRLSDDCAGYVSGSSWPSHPGKLKYIITDYDTVGRFMRSYEKWMPPREEEKGKIKAYEKERAECNKQYRDSQDRIASGSSFTIPWDKW